MALSKINLTNAISGTIPAGNINNNTISNITALPAAIPTGKLKLISSQTASASASIEFTSGIDSTYPIYQFEFINLHPSNNEQQLYMGGSVNSGSNYEATAKTSTCFRAYHTEGGSSGTLAYYTAGDLAQSTDAQYLSVEASNENDHGVSGTFTLFNPSSTTFVKHFISSSNSVYNDTSDYTMNFYVAGYFNTTSAINGIRFRFNTGNIDSGTIKLYGIKGD
jgi:hypothetical protein